MPSLFAFEQDAQMSLEAQLRETRAALEESVKLQSHYAGLLNAYDGGKRMQFKDAREWMRRLAEIKKGGRQP